MSTDADYIIIGGGAAGALLANRLSSAPENKVLLLEAGGRPVNPLIKIPLVAGLLYHWPGLNWGYETTPQKHMNDRAIVWPRGKVLGGSTAINGMMYMRGHRSDYDQWAQLGLKGWSYDDVLPHFRAFERNVSHKSGDQYHGRNGELHTEKAKGDHPLYRAWLEAGAAAGFPENEDFNGEKQEGLGLYDFNIKDGRRVTAASAFLDPVRHRQNLDIRTGHQAMRLLFEDKRCIGVEIARSSATEIFSAARGVILSAGAINSAQLLQVSGVGDGALLQGLGIDIVVDRPDVGRNLQDHLGVYVQNKCKDPITLYSLMRPDRAVWAGARAYLFGKGPGASVPLEAGGFLKTRDELDLPDIHITMVPGLSLATTQFGQMEHGFTTNFYQLRPESRGTIRIRSADAREKPLIDPNYLATETDRACLRDGVRLARRLVAQAPLERYRGDEIAPGADAQKDDEIDAWVRETANTIFHPVGTCRMGADDKAVLDGDLNVRGVDNLKVIDASVMPTIIGGNTAIPTMMIAEKAARTMLRRREPSSGAFAQAAE